MNNNDERRIIRWQKYILVFFLTLAVFSIGIILSKKFNNQRVENIDEIENNLYLNILSSEIQFSLLEEIGCKGITEKTILSSELRGLAKKIEFMENQLKDESDEFKNLKRKYELLQIKDYLLMKKLAKKCKLEPINILFFSSKMNEKMDDDSKKEFYVLKRLERDNPRLRVYYFDYDLPLSALRSLLIAKKVSGEKFPAIVINDKVYTGFQSLEKIQKLLPKLEIIDKKYLKYWDGEESRIEIQCSEDKQCKIEKGIFSACGFPVAINLENKEEEIKNFSQKEELLANKIKSSCASLKEFSDEVFCNKEHICEVRESKEK